MIKRPFSSLKPVNLHVSHSWGGGLGLWVEEFARADSYSENLVLESVGTSECFGIGLRLRHLASDTTLQSWVLRHPITEVRGSHAEYAAILGTICAELGIDHIYVSSVVGHSLDLYRLGLPVTQIYHDYFPYCPALFIFRDGVCTSCTEEDLRQCRLGPAAYSPRSSPGYYRELRDELFEVVAAADVRHVCPSRSLFTNLRRIDPRFEAIDFTIIEHGLALRRRDCFGGAEDGRRLRVGLLGYLNWNKGLEIIRRTFEVARTIVDFHFIGAHDQGAEFAGRWGSHYVHHYSHQDLPALFEQNRLDLALLLPIVPESFSFTLSEAWCFCIPPAARPLGALAERIEEGSDGFFLGLADEDLIDFLLCVDRERDELRQMAARLAAKPVRSVQEVVDDYYMLRTSYPDQLGRSLEQTIRTMPRTDSLTGAQ